MDTPGAQQQHRSGSELIHLVQVLADSEGLDESTPVAERIVSRSSWDLAVANPELSLSDAVANPTERASSLLERAIAVWWDLDAAREFVLSHQARLDGAPLDLAAESVGGARRVEKLLVRIDHGLIV